MLRIWLAVIVFITGVAGFVLGFDLAYRKVVTLLDKSEQGRAPTSQVIRDPR